MLHLPLLDSKVLPSLEGVRIVVANSLWEANKTLGANHVFRGLNRTRQYDIGAMLAQLAEAEGGQSFHLLVVGGPDTQHAVFNPVRLTYEPQPVGLLSSDLPFAELLLPDVWTVFDVRPLRTLIHDGRMTVPESLSEIVFNFDAVLVLSGSTPAAPWFDPGEVLRRR